MLASPLMREKGAVSFMRKLLNALMIGTTLLAGSSYPVHASQQDIATINNASCELLKTLYDEGTHKSGVRPLTDEDAAKSRLNGYLNILNKLPVAKGEFGIPEANALSTPPWGMS